MRRRALLERLGGLAGATAIAGCLGDSGGRPVDTPTDQPTDPGGDPPTPTGTSFDVLTRSCGAGENAASVSFGDRSVRVDGVIGGRDTCDTAQLAAAAVDDGELVVIVEVVEEPHTTTVACAECLTDIEYAFEATFPDPGPASVRVVHRSADGESTVATAARP